MYGRLRFTFRLCRGRESQDTIRGTSLHTLHGGARRGLASGLGARERRGLCASGCPQPVRLPLELPLAASGHNARVLPPPPVSMSFGMMGLAGPVFAADSVLPVTAPGAAVERGEMRAVGVSAALNEVAKEARGEGIGDG